MLRNIGFSEILVIALAALLLFGPKKLPEIGRNLGRALRTFTNEAKGIVSDTEEGPSTDGQNQQHTKANELKPVPEDPMAADSGKRADEAAETPGPDALPVSVKPQRRGNDRRLPD